MIFSPNTQHSMDPTAAALRWLPVAALLSAWEVAARCDAVDRLFLPPPTEIARTVWALLRTGALLEHIAASMARVAAGFVVALALGVSVGTWLGNVRSEVRQVIDPFLRVLSQVNPFSLLPVFLLVFGSGESVKVAALAWVAIWPVLFFSAVGVAQADPTLIKAARSLGASSRVVLYQVALPSAVPSIFVGIRIAAGLVFFVLVGAEMLGTNAGLGWLVHNASMNYQVHGIYASALVVVVLGYLISRTLARLERSVYLVFRTSPETRRVSNRTEREHNVRFERAREEFANTRLIVRRSAS